MGVDWFKCEKCTTIVCDAGYYESCEGCGARFCNRKCAEIKTTFDDDGEEEQT